MTRWISRILISIVFALPLMLITYVAAKAADAPLTVSLQTGTGEKLDCASCHQAFQDAVTNGAHGNASSDPVFIASWESQSKPAECMACHATGYDAQAKTWQKMGIDCVVCHSPETAGHPLAPMAMDRSSELCGKCHTDAVLQWKASQHSAKGVECVTCHDPHATGLKITDVNALCATCHKELVNDFAHSQHAAQGLTCASCHLPKNTETMGNGVAKMDHTFKVDLNTCNACHQNQLHTGSAMQAQPAPSPTPDAMAATSSEPISKDPMPVSPLGFTALSGLLGIGLGIILTPWLERLYMRIHSFGNR